VSSRQSVYGSAQRPLGAGDQLSVAAFARAKELHSRIWFTLAALVVYRLGTYIPLPGIDSAVVSEMFKSHGGGLFGMFDMFAGGALDRMTIFALNIMPYITASIIMQLMTAVSPSLEAMKKEGESGRKQINQYTRYAAVLLAMVQGYGLAIGIESMRSGSLSAVLDPGLSFRLTTMIMLTGGTVFLMWLGEQMTFRGIGNGTSMIIFAGIVANLPLALGNTLELGRTGALSIGFIFAVLVLVIAVVYFIVYVERAQRRLLVQYPKRQVGMRMTGGGSTHLPLKINSAGVIPPIFASSLLLLPTTIASAGLGADAPEWLSNTIRALSFGQPLHMVLYAFMIIFFSFFYTAVVFNPVETADNIKKNGGFILGIRPGKHTADYLDFILTRLTVVSALYMTIVCLLPEFLIAHYGLPFMLGGTSLLIVVSVTMETVTQISGHMLAHQYEGLMKKSGLQGRRS
jgi:preprotein translocase subunit SecY